MVVLLILIVCRSRNKYPLVVRFEGEPGIDQGGLRLNFLTLVIGKAEMILGGSCDETGLDEDDFVQLLYAAGVFVGGLYMRCN